MADTLPTLSSFLYFVISFLFLAGLVLFFEKRFLSATALAVLELDLKTRLTLNPQRSSYLSLPHDLYHCLLDGHSDPYLLIMSIPIVLWIGYKAVVTRLPKHLLNITLLNLVPRVCV